MRVWKPRNEDKLLKLGHLAFAHCRFAIQTGKCKTDEEVIEDVGMIMLAAFQIGRASVG